MLPTIYSTRQRVWPEPSLCSLIETTALKGVYDSMNPFKILQLQELIRNYITLITIMFIH